MRIGETIFVFFRVPKAPSIQKLVGYTTIKTELFKKFPSCAVFVTDEKFMTTTQDEFKKLLEVNHMKNRKWTWDKYDCDNYAFSLKALIGDIIGNLTFGIVFVDKAGGKHALNIFRDNKGEYFYVEPQNNKIFSVGGVEAIQGAYKPYLIII